MRIILIPLLVGLVSCSSIQKMAIRSASPLFRDGSDQLTKERDWEFFKASVPANLKFLEMLYLNDPLNTTLLAVLAKGYAGYAFGIHETEAFGEELAGKEGGISSRKAISFYTRALDYGLTYLDRNSISRKDLLGLSEEELLKKMDKELREKDLAAVAYTAQAWGSLINLQKDNIALVSQVPRVKLLFDWVCKTNPNFENGICDIFFAQYEASRPRMLGGNPEKAEQMYHAAIMKYPHHLLIRVGLIQYLYLPGFEQKKYEAQAEVLRNEFKKWEDLSRDGLENHSEYRISEELNLFNAIAKKRFEYIEKNKKKIFGE